MATNLCSGACQIRTEHHDPWGCVGELLAAGLESILKKLDVSTTTIAALLVLDFVLDNQRFILEINGLLEGSRDGVMGSLALGDETLVALNEGERGLLDGPFTNIAERFTADGSLLSRLGRCPPL